MLPDHLQRFHDEPIHVLDHGIMQLVDVMGDDAAICDFARGSTGTRGKGEAPEQVRKLVRNMMRQHHTTPFERCEIVVYMKLPIFVSRQWVRHRTAVLVERSMRYTTALPEQYVPEEWRGMENQPCITLAQMEADTNQWADELWRKASREYNSRIAAGVEKGLARICMPLSTYTEWQWKCDLHNTLNLLHQRLDKHAQWETRQYAEALAQIVKAWVPETWAAFEEYVLSVNGGREG